jgi:hypothetical protein
MLVLDKSLGSMTPQSNFTIIAPILPKRMANLKRVLGDMNVRPGTPNACLGTANPHNDVIPFWQFKKLHTARFVILDDQTLGDFERMGEPVPDYGPLRLAFMADCDGSADELLAELAAQARDGLQRVFENCDGFDPNNLLGWMNQHSVPAAATYVNHIGRTACQIRKEDILRTKLICFLKKNPLSNDPQATRNQLIGYAQREKLIPPPPEPTPVGWRVRNFLHCIALPAILVVFLVALLAALWIAVTLALGCTYPVVHVRIALGLLAAVLLAVLLFVVILRSYETAEPEINGRPADAYTERLAQDEDHDVVNQYSVMGSVKPSAFRRAMLIVNLWVIDWVARHLLAKGFLARIRTIHFARWVFIDDKKRLVFASTYDGSLESYNDDFINKSGFGLNFAFASGLGYPRCRWLLLDGASREQKFKYTLRRHQIPTQVWYNAYPGLTVYDLARNARVREGLERPTMSDAEIRKWLADL